MNYFTQAFYNSKSKISINWVFGLIVVFLLNTQLSFGQTYYNMTTADYTQNFNGLSTAYPTNFNGLAILATGSIPVATKATTATNGALTTVGASTAIGYDAASSTKMIFLVSGVADNSGAVATDLNLNFTGRNAGNLSFDYAMIFNTATAVGRATTLVVYYSIDGTNWSSLTSYTVYNTTGNSTANVNTGNIALPSALNNQGTVKLRFYAYNGGTVVGTPTGSRPKISIDNVAATSTSAGGPATTIGLANTTVAAANINQSHTQHHKYFIF